MNVTEKESGVLGGKTRIRAASGRKGAERELSDAEVKRLFDVGVGAEAEKLQEGYMNELEQLLRPGLEKEYSRELLTRPAVTPEQIKEHAKLFKAFAAELKAVDCKPLPARSTFVASYLHVAATNGGDEHALKAMADAIAYAHRLKNLTDPTVDPLVQAVLARPRATVVEHKSNGAAAEVATQ
jgi:hypothetical protein